MQITPERLLLEAGQMALELRFKDHAIAALEAENGELRSQLADRENNKEILWHQQK